jgi:hypothetical protein
MPSPIGHATHEAAPPLSPFEPDRRPVGPENVRIDIAPEDAGFRPVTEAASLSLAAA